MPVELNHTIVWCHDKERSSAFLADILGRPAPAEFLHFRIVELDNGVSLDFMQKEGAVARQHYAFLVSEEEFDGIFARIKGAGLTYWADPSRSVANEINHLDGGRGMYFEDPDGHLLEILTRPYGSGQ
ncbi:VOC family protein [Rhizorhapis sp.]|uniref:VOC family protein n=1 Tax=Rhizorhapis sp. TaxID=1968842 RepID=UPI002B460ADB|nr:VOC family protein [Rhizorhapis sp.]HKR15813.1 VOC family protein [Rhizorhapis sp.]